MGTATKVLFIGGGVLAFLYFSKSAFAKKVTDAIQPLNPLNNNTTTTVPATGALVLPVVNDGVLQQPIPVDVPTAGIKPLPVTGLPIVYDEPAPHFDPGFPIMPMPPVYMEDEGVIIPEPSQNPAAEMLEHDAPVPVPTIPPIYIGSNIESFFQNMPQQDMPY